MRLELFPIFREEKQLPHPVFRRFPIKEESGEKLLGKSVSDSLEALVKEVDSVLDDPSIFIVLLASAIMVGYMSAK